jgi:hypothetical protein
MFIGIYFIGLFKKITASLNDGLNPVAEPQAGLDLGRLAMTSMNFSFREAAVLWGLLLTFLSQTLQT